VDTVRALKQVMIFRDVPEPVLGLVASAAEELTIPAGETIVCTENAPNALYVIRNGTVRVLIEEEGAPPVLFGAGETIGDVEFIDGGPGPVSVTALEAVDLLMIRSDRLSKAFDGHPESASAFYRAVAKSLAGRLRRAVAMVALARQGADRGAVDPPITRSGYDRSRMG
jgi:CRP/FNR family transcriptional regulator, cyclic AMP receptor protein